MSQAETNIIFDSSIAPSERLWRLHEETQRQPKTESPSIFTSFFLVRPSQYIPRKESTLPCFTDEEMALLIQKIYSLRDLPDNWNGYGASPISIRVIKDVHVFLAYFPSYLPLPKLNYSADDEVLLYWEHNGDRYDLSFYGDDMIYAYRRKNDSEEDYPLLLFPAAVEEHLRDLLEF